MKLGKFLTQVNPDRAKQQGVDSLTIKDLGRWESLETVERYTRSVKFEDSLRLYRAIA